MGDRGAPAALWGVLKVKENAGPSPARQSPVTNRMVQLPLSGQLWPMEAGRPPPLCQTLLITPALAPGCPTFAVSRLWEL